ncbi:hypothetical protein Nmel_007831, partial [Mimus melanotis]
GLVLLCSSLGLVLVRPDPGLVLLCSSPGLTLPQPDPGLLLERARPGRGRDPRAGQALARCAGSPGRARRWPWG